MTIDKCKTISLSNGGSAIVDPEDYEFLNQWRWRKSDSGYAIRTVHIGGIPYTRRMHRIVADAPDGVMIDHKNRNRLDNRRKNLRFSDYPSNNLNRSLSKDRKFRGVYANGKKFEARIKNKSKIEYLGMFETDVQAAQAFDIAAKAYRGEKAVLNFPAD